ncbi:rhodanese-like domain-containing protein [Arthrobacter sp. AL08]|uniref:rhodanese-like domain-containing protein n=1 Tax=Micrococcaceae TaxID=1268 RepID=UPI00249C1CF3|nr:MULTISPECIES: rhodanese-like domain-containing protein [Micrococcaceae]MDI3240381.1 rhodanese-like domain-containing protein [Arthrobacter sp. AL05]MDI3276391.1 rhodanese-like domain-containing protein [Arthrobacter sp. AL08]MDJ0353720.1 rhodanese-like domain-containing protein [Pseudarthrobacter sp. PH31-O2]
MSYAGDLSPQEAWSKLGDGAILVDVRTEGEWASAGIPDTKATENDPLFIQWSLAGGIPNSQFLAQLRQQAPEAGGTELLFLCRSGARSVAAAIVATEDGFTSFNILEGFEGEPDGEGQRTVNGWKNRGLPTNLGRH